MKRTQYKTCPLCGAHLDPGERCDCADEAKKGGKDDAEDRKGKAA